MDTLWTYVKRIFGIGQMIWPDRIRQLSRDQACLKGSELKGPLGKTLGETALSHLLRFNFSTPAFR
jgi:hypothetical protein